jgi:hypothetical protein
MTSAIPPTDEERRSLQCARRLDFDDPQTREELEALVAVMRHLRKLVRRQAMLRPWAWLADIFYR